MSQGMLTYTLPNGTQVLIQTFENKDESLPLVLYDGQGIADTFLNESESSVLLPGIQVVENDLDNVDSTCILDASSEVANNLQSVYGIHANLKCCTDEELSFENSLENSDLCKVIEVQGTLNCFNSGEESKNEQCGVESSGTGRTPSINEICSDNVYSVLSDNGVILGSSREDQTIQSLLDKPVTIHGKNTRSECSLQINDTLCSDEEDPNVDEIGIAEIVTNEIMLPGYPGIAGNGSGSLCQLTATSSSESILEQACHSVALTLEDVSDLKTVYKLGGSSDCTILENLDEFAEMVMWFKCRLCKFGAGSKEDLLDHIRGEHLAANVTLDTAKVNANILRDGEISSEADTTNVSKIEFPPVEQAAVSERLVYLCGQCNFGFHTLDACKQHMMKDHDLILQIKDEENNTCDSPKPQPEAVNTVKDESRAEALSSSSPSPKKELSETKKHNKSHKCPFRGCQSKFSDEKSLQIHTNCHSTSDNCREFRCCECESQFERWRSCAMHLWKVHNIDCGLLTCPVCLKYKSATSLPLENHMRIHGEERCFSCPECGKAFKQAAQLHNHRVMHLDRKTSELPRWYASKRCDICFKNYANSKCLKKHIQAVHSKLRPYVCQVCGHASARKAMLQLHYRQHTGEKPHSCPLCDYRTGDHNSLRRHVMRHTGQRPYRCPHCPYGAIQSNSYKNHLRSKHPGASGVYSCVQCKFKTVSHEGYLLHISDHKNGVIGNSSDGNGSDVEVFPGNVAAAQLIYRCLSALSADGIAVEASVTGSSTSADGTTQTITIQIPTQEAKDDTEDEDEPHFLLEGQRIEEEEEIDTGGITIPADPEQTMICQATS